MTADERRLLKHVLDLLKRQRIAEAKKVGARRCACGAAMFEHTKGCATCRGRAAARRRRNRALFASLGLKVVKIPPVKYRMRGYGGGPRHTSFHPDLGYPCMKCGHWHKHESSIGKKHRKFEYRPLASDYR